MRIVSLRCFDNWTFILRKGNYRSIKGLEARGDDFCRTFALGEFEEKIHGYS